MYELFDNEGKKVEHHDLQDKSHWCKDGEEIEEVFVRLYGAQLNLAINPAKATDPYAQTSSTLQLASLPTLRCNRPRFSKPRSFMA